MNLKQFILLSGAFALLNCSPGNEQNAFTSDKKATEQTQALFKNLKGIAKSNILFGQQDATAYGVDRNDPVKGFSDVHDVTGAYPSLYGFDIGHIDDSVNVDSVPFTKIKRLIKEAHSRGGVITISWHENFPGSGTISSGENRKISRVLPGGDYNLEWKEMLNKLAGFFNELKDEKGNAIPVIFRPYHEHNGDWFWWGTKENTAQEYIDIFKYTVHYLRDSLNIHHLLYAISPDRSRMKTAHADEDFLYAYPGDDYIDIIGLDNYWDVGRSSDYVTEITRSQQDSLFLSSLRAVVRISESKGKIPVLAETGQDKLKENNWFTSRILEPLKNDSIANRIAYILVWRNASQKHFYTPYPGHGASEDFLNFYKDEMIVFENELTNMYVLE